MKWSGARTLAEWVTLGLSLLIIGSLIAVALVEESRRENEGGPSLLVTFDSEGSTQEGESYYVPFTVENTGSKAISSADIGIDVYDGDEIVESADITVEFLPLQGQQHGIYVSTHDPATYRLHGRLESMQFP